MVQKLGKNTSTFKVTLIEFVDAQSTSTLSWSEKCSEQKIYTKALLALSFKSDYMLIESKIWFPQ
jgi:hypothetical protein